MLITLTLILSHQGRGNFLDSLSHQGRGNFLDSLSHFLH